MGGGEGEKTIAEKPKKILHDVAPHRPSNLILGVEEEVISFCWLIRCLDPIPLPPSFICGNLLPLVPPAIRPP